MTINPHSDEKSKMLVAPAEKCHRLLAPRIAFLIGTNGRPGPNIAPISNVTQASSKPQMFVAAIYRQSQTYENLQHSKGFALSVPRVEHADVVWRLGEKFSGFRVPTGQDKLQASGGTFDFGASRFGPILADAIGWCDCELMSQLSVPDGDHGLFLARVVGGAFNSEYMNVDGTYTKNSTPLMQLVLNMFSTSVDAWELPWLGDQHP
jgi:flavin reductase (DIM6/NTAB) family NADH-FMN oxidoreductase RutF